MRIIDDTVCKEKINELFKYIDEWFMSEEIVEQLELNEIPEETIKKDEYNKHHAIQAEKELKQYINILDYKFPNKDLMKLIINELYLYMKNYPKYYGDVNNWELCRTFKKFLNEPLS
jgi:hypothetical protein